MFIRVKTHNLCKLNNLLEHNLGCSEFVPAETTNGDISDYTILPGCSSHYNNYYLILKYI